ncbi:hypothetical protein SEA_ANON_89 [Gordonia phage Anon]|nr:hypothetical protein SEA_ANON_89 [Gordonia phage Anon]
MTRHVIGTRVSVSVGRNQFYPDKVILAVTYDKTFNASALTRDQALAIIQDLTDNLPPEVPA